MILPRVLEVLDTDPIISLEEQKLFARVDYEIENTIINKIVEAATCACEKWVGLYFRRKRVEWGYQAPAYRFNHDCVPVFLPYGPNQSIVSVTRVDDNGVETILTTDEYTVSGFSFLSLTNERRSSLTYYGRSYGNMRIVYTAGYHATDIDPLLVYPLEEDMIQAVRMLATELNENRQISVSGTIVATLDVTHKTLLAPYRRNVLF